jgi:hypothetical protein
MANNKPGLWKYRAFLNGEQVAEGYVYASSMRNAESSAKVRAMNRLVQYDKITAHKSSKDPKKTPYSEWLS